MGQYMALPVLGGRRDPSTHLRLESTDLFAAVSVP